MFNRVRREQTVVIGRGPKCHRDLGVDIGSRKTQADTAWMPLIEAPMHPEYPCAHCINAAAVATVLQALVGDPGTLSTTEVGARMGRAVGEFVVGKVMRPS